MVFAGLKKPQERAGAYLQAYWQHNISELVLQDSPIHNKGIWSGGLSIQALSCCGIIMLSSYGYGIVMAGKRLFEVAYFVAVSR